MEIERFYLGCLAHASYFIHDAGEAAVIDPQRDVDLYIDEARKRGVRIRWVIETHLHADFVSGHLELAGRTGAAPLEQRTPLHALSPLEVEELQSRGAMVLDTRPVMQFAVAHIPGSIHVALKGQFASWAARILAADSDGVDVQVILVAEDEEAAQESRLRLARVGIENIAGYARDGIFGWIRAGKDINYVAQISARDLAEWLESGPHDTTVVDVRERSERSAGSIPGSVSIPLPELRKRLDEIDRTTTVFVHCKGGYRSSITTSILLQAGFPKVGNVTGGYDAWTQLPA